MNERTPYQKEMDQIHLSDEKANETLRMMLAENTRLRAKETAVRAPKKWLKPALVSVAAAALALVLIFTGQKSPAYTWQSIRTDALPAGGISRADDAAVTFEEAFGQTAEELFTGAVIVEETAHTWTVPAGERHQGDVTLEAAGIRLNAAVTDFEPAIGTLIEKEQQLKGRPVRLAREGNTLYAVYQQNGLHVVLTSQGADESAMLKALEDLSP